MRGGLVVTLFRSEVVASDIPDDLRFLSSTASAALRRTWWIDHYRCVFSRGRESGACDPSMMMGCSKNWYWLGAPSFTFTSRGYHERKPSPGSRSSCAGTLRGWRLGVRGLCSGTSVQEHEPPAETLARTSGSCYSKPGRSVLLRRLGVLELEREKRKCGKLVVVEN